MRVFLYGISAFSHWLTVPQRPSSVDIASARAFTNCKPSQAAISFLGTVLPHIAPPFHLAVPRHSIDSLPNAIVHLSTFAYSGKPFCRIQSGVFAPCPELCFVQLATAVPFHELVKAGNALCGRYRIAPAAKNGLSERAPLTTTRKIGSFLRSNSGLRGAKAARLALRSVVDNAASPPEAFLCMVLGLPHRLGGFQMSDLRANQRLHPTKKAQAIAQRETLVPDVYFPRGRTVVEYDSNAEHMTPHQIARDAAKRLALEADGYKVITVTAQQLGSPREMLHVAEQASRREGRRLRPQSAHFSQQQAELFKTGWSLREYHREEWLASRPL